MGKPCAPLAPPSPRTGEREITTGGPIALEYVDSAASPLAVHRLYGDRHRQFRHHGIWAAALLGGLFAAAPAVPASVQRSVHVRAAVCRQAARPVRRGNGESPRFEPRASAESMRS